ncbi:hypothetical protein GIB67_039149, partial [Kingdonia uniflora]
MTPTLDDVDQLVGLPADGDAMVIGGTWGFPTILEVFENNLLQDLNAFKSLKAGGAGNLLSLRKLKEHYTYKLEKVLSDSTAAAAKKKKGLTMRSVARAYMLFILGSFLFPTKKGTNVSARYLYLFAKDKSLIFAHFPKLAGIPKEMDYDAYEQCTCWKLDVFVTDRYGGTTLLKFREALDNYKLEDNAKEPRKFNPKYEWVDCFSGQKRKEFILKKADRGRRVRERPQVCTEAYLEWFASVSLTTIYPITINLATNDDVGIHQRKEASVNEHGDTPVHQSEDIQHEHASPSPNAHGTLQTRGGSGSFDQQITTLNDQLQKLKEDKEKESEANITLREALKEKTSECDLLKETIEQMKEEIELKRVVNEQCALEFADLSRQLDAKCKESESLKAVNAFLMEQIDLQLLPATPLVVLQSHQPVPDTTLAKKYEDLLAAHEDVKKKLIVKEDFEDWRQALKKALASEGMGDTGDPTFEELFEQSERFYTITQQGPKRDYQEDLVSTAWTKYLVDVHGVEISDNNSGFRVTSVIQHHNQHRFPDVMKSLKTFLCKDPAFWKSIFSQTLGIQFTPD